MRNFPDVEGGLSRPSIAAHAARQCRRAALHPPSPPHANPAGPSQLPLRRRRDCRQLAAGVGGLPERCAEERRVPRHPVHRRDDGPHRGRTARGHDPARRRPTSSCAPRSRPAIYKAQATLKMVREIDPEGGDGARRHPRHVHVRPGAQRGAVDRLHRARRGRGDRRQPGQGDRRRHASGHERERDQGTRLPQGRQAVCHAGRIRPSRTSIR